ncbi:MAG: TldD/PmbA family protein [Clostridia bacterium]|nr:TldD/PmbA family protein [Clostridia bacterium]
MQKVLNKDQAKEILEVCLNTGGDFAEIFFQDSVSNLIEMKGDKVVNIVTTELFGCSVRVLDGAREVFGRTNDTSFESVMELARSLAASIDSEKKNIDIEFKPNRRKKILKPSVLPRDLDNGIKIGYMKDAIGGVKEEGEKISQILARLSDEEQQVYVYNSLGKAAGDLRSHVRIMLTVVAADGADKHVSNDSVGGNCGYEFLEKIDLRKFGKELAQGAIKMLDAVDIPGGKMTVVIHNAFGGVLLHEACVHSLEATSVAKGASVFCGKLGQKIAADIVTAVDDGTLYDDSWGSLNMDDEGTPTQRNVLIENGILKTYLVDYRNSRLMNHPVTGSARRQSYKYSPTSRMTNTFFAPGKDKCEDIIANTEYGLFAKSMGGGSVVPATGEFNFSVDEAYLIENGKLTKPVKGATLIGSGAEILMNIDMIADNLDFGHGMCGSLSGSVPTNVGQPTIRVQNITVGGKGGNA